MRSLFVLMLCVAVTTSAATLNDLVREGELKLQAGELESAAVIFRAAVAMDERSALAHIRLGGALLLGQERTAAIEQFRKAIALDAGNADAFVGMAIAEIHLGRYGLARAALEEAKAIDPGKGEDVDSVVVWLDARMAGTSHEPPTPEELSEYSPAAVGSSPRKKLSEYSSAQVSAAPGCANSATSALGTASKDR